MCDITYLHLKSKLTICIHEVINMDPVTACLVANWNSFTYCCQFSLPQ